jgi:hypothetical protein
MTNTGHTIRFFLMCGLLLWLVASTGEQAWMVALLAMDPEDFVQ